MITHTPLSRTLFITLALSATFVTILALALLPVESSHLARAQEPQPPGTYRVIGWNDLGMHCYNGDFQDLAILPPFNTLWAQVIRVGPSPQIVTSGVRVSYHFPDNTTSVGKTNFWEYDQQLFGVDLPPDVGLAGKGLAGNMDPAGDHFVAEGIPLTELSDSDLSTPDPYQLATIVVYDEATGAELARNQVVAPVSTEMHCGSCHHDGGIRGIATGRVETNILTLHDQIVCNSCHSYPYRDDDDHNRDGDHDGDSQNIPLDSIHTSGSFGAGVRDDDGDDDDEGPANLPGHPRSLMEQRPVLCADCHASNALGKPGMPGIPNLSNAMHSRHSGKIDNTLEGCYSCHPGPQTQCLRDTMSQSGMTCINCHGGIEEVAQNPQPWLNEPRCDSCHPRPGRDVHVEQNNPLYRMSTGHGGLYCAACHDSPHAIAPSREPEDGIKFTNLQGNSGTLRDCTVCHGTVPDGPGPHGIRPQSTGQQSTPPAPVATPTPVPAPDAGDQRCFDETGFCIAGRIREFWEQNGGLSVFGYPTTSQHEMMIEGQSYQVQWFERNRLELHPENAPPYDVLTGRVGDDRLQQQGRSWFEFPRSEPQADCRYVEETGHNVCGDILHAWLAHGIELDGVLGTSEQEAIALYGLPLSDAQMETLSDGNEYMVQWFERARFEIHPENQPPFHVLQGLLGNDIREASGQ